MEISNFKSILIGLLIGLLFFIATKLMVVLLIAGAIIKLSGLDKIKREQWKERRMSFIEKVRKMNDEEFNSFKENFKAHHRSHSIFNTKKAKA